MTIADIGAKAGVAGSTVYAVYKSKTGILRALMEQTLFGGRFQSAQEHLAGVTDPVELVARTPRVARAIYENESRELGLLRNASGFSPELRKVEEEFERIRYDMQEPGCERCSTAARLARPCPSTRRGGSCGCLRAGRSTGSWSTKAVEARALRAVAVANAPGGARRSAAPLTPLYGAANLTISRPGSRGGGLPDHLTSARDRVLA